MNMTRWAAVLALAVIAAHTAWADETAERARAITKENADAVVTLRFVLNQQMSMPGFGSEDSEMVAENTGTVINPDGLIVASLSETNPMGMFEQMFGSFGEEMGLDFDTQVDKVTIIRQGGVEIPGRVVIRDVDLDLAFIRPDEPPEDPWTAVDLDGESSVKQYDEVLVLHRLGRVANRACAGTFIRIAAVMTKPRPFYVLNAVEGALGAPAFTSDGTCLGITTLRTLETAGAGAGAAGGLFGMLGGMSDMANNLAQVILPAADVLDSAAQAPGYDDADE